MSVSLTRNTTTETGSFSIAMIARLSILLLTAVAISANFTNYSPLIPLLQSELHISNGQVGLFSTFLYAGIACSYLPGGILADRYGSRSVLLGSLLLIGAGGYLLPLFTSLPWMVFCRMLTGLGSGAAIVAGSQAAARLGNYAALGQGLYGGAMQLGAGLGLFVTPWLLAWSDWRGVFQDWGLVALVICLIWASASSEETRAPHRFHFRRVERGFRSPAMLCLGLTHLGTFGMGQAVAPWLALYFVYAYQLPLGPAAMLGSIGLLAGMLFRPLGGVLVARRVFSAIALMRVGTLLTCLALGILALPMHVLPLVGIGITLLSFGTTLPYAAVFNEAGCVGKLTGLGTGTAQGIVSLLSTPASSLGPPLIGLLVVQEGGTSSFSVAFGVLALVVLLTISTALLAGPALAHVPARSGRPRNTNTQQNHLFISEKTAQVPQDRNRNTQLEAALLHLQGRTQQFLPGTLPLIATFGSLANTGFGVRAVYTADATTIEQLLEAGGLPLLLPTPLSQEGTLDVPVEKQGFRHTFDQLIWPFFCQLLAQQIRGISFSENLDLHGELGDSHTVPFDGKAFTQVETQQESKRLLRSITLLVWLIGLPILEGGQEIQSLQAKGRRTASGRFRPTVNYDVDLSSTPWHEANDSGYSAFIAACAAYTPPALEALQPFRRELCDRLSR